MGIHLNSKLRGRWCVMVPPGAPGPNGHTSVEWFGVRMRSLSEARRLARKWNQPLSWRAVVRRYSRRFRDMCGEGDVDLLIKAMSVTDLSDEQVPRAEEVTIVFETAQRKMISCRKCRAMC